MIRGAAVLRCISDGVRDDRQILMRHHLNLLDRRHWELSTPSRALPVVEVLIRSGVRIDKLEQASSKSLVSLTPSMTRKELGLVQKLSHMLQQTSLPTTCHLVRSAADEDEAICAAYSAACATGACAVDALVNISFVRSLRYPSSVLMLLELVASRDMKVCWTRGKPCFSKEILDSVCDLLAHHELSLDLRATMWLLSLLGSSDEWSAHPIAPSAGERLFRLCVRRIHHLLPDLPIEDLLLAYLGLACTRGYEKPFIVLGEMEKLVLSTSSDRYTDVRTQVLLRFMTMPFAKRHANLNLRLCAGWGVAARVADFTQEECLTAFTIIATLHECQSAECAVSVAPLQEWETLHDALFAQVFFVAHSMTAVECFRILDQSELINISGWGITVPQTLLDKLKRRILCECKLCVMDESRAPESVELLLSVAVGLQALMQRYTVLPSNAADEHAVTECITLLERCRTISPADS